MDNRKKIFLKSVRFKITLWYMLILAVVLSVFSALIYQNMENRLYESVDNLIQSRAEGISDAIDTYWETKKFEEMENERKAIGNGRMCSRKWKENSREWRKTARSGRKAGRNRGRTTEDEDNIEPFSKLYNINFAKIARNWVEEKSQDVKLINTIVQIFDSDGNQIVSSKNISNKLTLPREILSSTLKGNNELYDFDIDLPGNKSLPLRVFIMPVIEHGRIAYIVQVASPLNLVNTGLNKLKATLLILIPLTVFLTAALGVFLVKLTLDPVDSMIKTIRQITAENLKLRIDIPDTKDEIKRLADTFNDMLTRLDHAFSFQKQFIQDVSHELRTPLTILKGEFEIALKKSRSHQEYKSVLVSSLEEINKISQMVEGLLTLARLDNQEIKFAMKRLELNALLESVLDDMRVLAFQKAISIDLLTLDKIILEADENQMRCVFVNLLDNAIKYTHPKGKITINIHKDNNLARVKVSDTGIGIPENELHLVFDRFYQVEKSRSGSGFGLGLSIVRSILDAHHGRIEVESRQGQGTTFTIFLPLSCSP